MFHIRFPIEISKRAREHNGEAHKWSAGERKRINTQRIDRHCCGHQRTSYVVQSALPQVHKHENQTTNQNFTTDP